MSLYRYNNPGFLIHTSLIVLHCVNRYLVFTSLLDGVRLLSITTVVELAEFSWWFLVCKPILVCFMLPLQNTWNWVASKEQRFVIFPIHVEFGSSG